MNQFSRNSILAQRLLGIANALKTSGQRPGDKAAALYPSLASSLQRMYISSESGGTDDGAIGTEEPPKKRRGRPPKAKPNGETETAEQGTHSVSDSDASNSAESSSPIKETSTSKKAASSPARAPRPKNSQPRPKPKPLLQGLSTIINPISTRDSANWHSGASVADLNPSNTASSSSSPPFGFYVDVPATALPEAEASFYYDPLLTEERVKQVHYGCKAATAEFEFSGKRFVMHRPVIATVLEKALSENSGNSGANSNKIYVEGWTGAGKSMALYTLAATARAAGKVVMYIPTASLLTQGGRFYRREEPIEDGEDDSTSTNSTVWDTPEAARHILTAVMNAHSDQLATMPSNQNNKTTLAEVATAGLASTDASEIVEAAITVKDGILAHENGMVIVDEYNALYSHTGYHENMHQFYRRPLAVDELRLAKSFRILEDSNEEEEGKNMYKGVAVVAPSYGGRISPTLRILQASRKKKSARGGVENKKSAPIEVVRVPRYDLNEVSAFAAMSVGTGGLPSMPEDVELRRALALTNGNAKELREMQSTLLLAEGPLGVSLGYKAFAVAKKEYNVALEM